MGARILLVGRDAGRLERVRTELVAWTGHQGIATYRADMSSLASVREATDAILAAEPRIDVIVDNAGALFPTRSLTDEGFERTLATMVLGPFVLTSRLLPLLTRPARRPARGGDLGRAVRGPPAPRRPVLRRGRLLRARSPMPGPSVPR